MPLRRAIALAALAAPVGACMAPAAAPTTVEPPAPVASCSAHPAQRYLGSVATADLGAELLRVTGASVLRWVPPDTAVTMEYREGRLTVGYDRAMKITSIACT